MHHVVKENFKNMEGLKVETHKISTFKCQFLAKSLKMFWKFSQLSA